jgi:hypothetical protein
VIEKRELTLYIGAEVDAVDDKGLTPLLVGCSSGFFFAPQCCELLLELGANLNHIGEDGSTALSRAVHVTTGSVDTAETFMLSILYKTRWRECTRFVTYNQSDYRMN